MKELGIRIGDDAGGNFPVVGDAAPVSVREFTPFTLGQPLGKRPLGTVLSGQLFFGESRVYGRFTEARPSGGPTFPVCLELAPRIGRTRGAEREDVGGPADSAIVFSTEAVRAVERFE